MAEFKDRSFIFKFFYVLLFIITFPVFCLLFLLRHPVGVLVVLLLIAGAVVYYPYHQGIKFDDIPSWYQKKYDDLKYEAVLKARQKGITEFVPQAILEEAEKREEDAEEAKLPKSENYNNKVVRSAESEEMKKELKQRRGFKKKTENDDQVNESLESGDVTGSNVAEENETENKNEVSEEPKVFEETKASDIEKAVSEELKVLEKEEAEKTVEEIAAEVNMSEESVTEEIGKEAAKVKENLPEPAEISLEEEKANSAE